MTTDVVRSEPATSSFIVPVTTVEQAVERYTRVKEFIERVLKKDLDYGVIPGSDKPTLKKPGAEKMSSLFGLEPKFELIEKIEDWTGETRNREPFFFYHYRCMLAKNGRFLGDSLGSCNSWETKYRYRQKEISCPKCGQATVLKSKFPPKNHRNLPPGWYCYTKRGGCGAEFSHDDPLIVNQERGRIKNPDPAELVNTIDKMAQKRAFVAAVLIVTNTSDYFTQDIEDLNYARDAEYTEVEPGNDGAGVQSSATEAENGGNKPPQADPPTAKQAAAEDPTKATTGGKPQESDGRLPTKQQIIALTSILTKGRLDNEKIIATLDRMGRHFTRGEFSEAIGKAMKLEGTDRDVPKEVADAIKAVKDNWLHTIKHAEGHPAAAGAQAK